MSGSEKPPSSESAERNQPIIAAKYDALEQALHTLLTNQAALRGESTTLRDLAESAEQQVDAHTAATSGLAHHTGFAEDATSAMHGRLSKAEMVGLPELKATVEAVPARLELMTAQKDKLVEGGNELEGKNEAAKGSFDEQETTVGQIREIEAETKTSLGPVQGAAASLTARLGELASSLEALDRGKESVQATVDGEYRERWGLACDEAVTERRAQREDVLLAVQRGREQARDERRELLLHGARALAGALAGRRAKRLASARLAELEARGAAPSRREPDPRGTRVFFSAWRAASTLLRAPDDAADEGEEAEGTKPRTCRVFFPKHRVCRGVRLLQSVEDRFANAAVSRWRSVAAQESAIRATWAAIEPASVQQLLEELGWSEKISALQAQLASLSFTSGQDLERAGASWLEELAEVRRPLEEEAEEHLAARRTEVAAVRAQLDQVRARLPSRVDRAEALVRHCGDCLDRAKHLAERSSVDAVSQDVLLLWKSVKNLDSTKLGRKELDAMILEDVDRAAKRASANAQFDADACAEVGSVIDDMANMYGEMAPTVDEHSTKFQQLHEMLRKLSTFVEEMVAKLTELAAQSRTKLKPGVMTRTGGGYLRSEVQQRNRVPERTPPLRTGVPAEEGCDRWLDYARNMIDAPAPAR